MVKLQVISRYCILRYNAMYLIFLWLLGGSGQSQVKSKIV